MKRWTAISVLALIALLIPCVHAEIHHHQAAPQETVCRDLHSCCRGGSELNCSVKPELRQQTVTVDLIPPAETFVRYQAVVTRPAGCRSRLVAIPPVNWLLTVQLLI
ncbi:MAG: hypothetical protein AB7E95_00880 [Kiritimatiellales bacterium]